MRCLLILAMLPACGRLAFEDLPAVDADVDAELPPPVPVGCIGPDEDGDGWPNGMTVTDLRSLLQRGTDLTVNIPHRTSGFLEVNHMIVDVRYLVIYATR